MKKELINRGFEVLLNIENFISIKELHKKTNYNNHTRRLIDMMRDEDLINKNINGNEIFFTLTKKGQNIKNNILKLNSLLN